MTSLTESRAAFEARATDVGLSADDIAALLASLALPLQRYSLELSPPTIRCVSSLGLVW